MLAFAFKMIPSESLKCLMYLKDKFISRNRNLTFNVDCHWIMASIGQKLDATTETNLESILTA